jgi:hypothetical protein
VRAIAGALASGVVPGDDANISPHAARPASVLFHQKLLDAMVALNYSPF